MKRGPRFPWRAAPALILLIVLGAGLEGCAYFNTFSNAKRFFREAENTDRTPEGKVTPAARKKYGEAIEKCRKLMDLYPGTKWEDDALFLMARAYFERSEYGLALRRLDELDERYPEHPWGERALFMRGICHLEDGDEARAIAELQRLEADYPKSEHLAEGIYRSGEAEYRLGNWSAAADAYRHLLELFDESEWNDEARLKIAHAEREQEADSMAVATLMELAEVGRNRRTVFEGQTMAAEILFEQRRFEECMMILDELEPVAVNFQARGQVLLLQARVNETRGDIDDAVLQLENVATEFPSSVHAAEAWYRIGLIRQNREGAMEEAVEAYDLSRKALPRSLYADLAGKKRQAIQELLDYQSEFGEAPPESSAAEMQFRLAENQLLLLENPQAALEEYRRVLDDHADSPLAPQAAYAIAYIHRHSLADSSAALEAAELLLARYPESEAAAFVKNWREELEASP